MSVVDVGNNDGDKFWDFDRVLSKGKFLVELREVKSVEVDVDWRCFLFKLSDAHFCLMGF